MTSDLYLLVQSLLLACILGVLIAAGRLRFDIASRGWWVLFLGFTMLFVGSIAHVLPIVEIWREHFKGLEKVTDRMLLIGAAVGGAILLGMMLVSSFSKAEAFRRTGKLNQALIALRNKLASEQVILNGVLKSSLSAVVVVRAMRDDGGAIVDLRCELMNSAAAQLFARTADDLLGRSLMDELYPFKHEGLFKECVSVIESGLPLNEERQLTFGKSAGWVHVVAVKLGDRCALTFTDINERKQVQERLQAAAHHDALTGLPNRAKFLERLQRAVHRSKRYGDYLFAVLFLDFDRFKIINDSLGHEVGDGLLISIANRLRENLRNVDTVSHLDGGHLAARLGGDEFVVLLDGIRSAHDAARICDRLLQQLAMPHNISGHKVTSTASIGMVICQGNYDRPDDIVRDADTAMYEAKRTGKARCVVFNEKMHNEVMQRLHLEKELRDAVEQKAFELVYEPIVALESGEVVGFEALIRWSHPQRGMIRPGEFISLAEEVGLILPIGAWVVTEAARQLRQWQTTIARRADLPPLTMNVNISRRQLDSGEFFGVLEEVLRTSRIDPMSLVLEITESMVMDARSEMGPALDRLKSLGVALALDDFGTGYSSLGALHRFPIDVLKIDQSFLAGASEKREHAAIVHIIVELAHNLNMKVVAEGIEERNQLSLLQSLNCDYGQGYLFGQPLSAEQAKSLIRSGFRANAA